MEENNELERIRQKAIRLSKCNHKNVTYLKAVEVSGRGFIVISKCNNCGRIVLPVLEKLPEGFVDKATEDKCKELIKKDPYFRRLIKKDLLWKKQVP